MYAFNIIDIVTAAVVANMPALNVVLDVVIVRLKDFSKSGHSLRSLLVPRSNRRHPSSDDGELVEERDSSLGVKPPQESMYITTTGTLGAADMEQIAMIETTREQMG